MPGRFITSIQVPRSEISLANHGLPSSYNRQHISRPHQPRRPGLHRGPGIPPHLPDDLVEEYAPAHVEVLADPDISEFRTYRSSSEYRTRSASVCPGRAISRAFLAFLPGPYPSPAIINHRLSVQRGLGQQVRGDGRADE